jgi:alpha-tubulin suppressor-like RCC1 family protein
MKNPKQIKFESESKIKIKVEKVFCGFHHCFALSANGDIYAWGNPRNFRLTQEYGDSIPKNPKMINITWKSDRNTDVQLEEAGKADGEKNEEEGNQKPPLDERHIISMIRTKKKVLSIKEIFVLTQLKISLFWKTLTKNMKIRC